LGRIHLFELEDQPWLPALLRSFGTDVLQFNQTFVDQSEPLAAPLARLARGTRSRRFVDLCSGSSGPWARLLEHLPGAGCDLPVVLTDLYPVDGVADRLPPELGDRVSCHAQPVDATAVPGELDGVRTLFNGFHHFRPATARAILQDAVDDGQPIAVAEFVARSPLAMIGIALAALVVTPIVTLAIRPFRFSRLLFTYIVPIVPLLVLWDGLVSCLRVYSPRELDSLVEGLDAEGWRFEVEQLRNPSGPIPITLLIGWPPQPGDQRAHDESPAPPSPMRASDTP
jgi:hypothetical protein